MSNIASSIKDVVQNKLCVGCGSCYAVCPRNAINIELGKSGFFFPTIELTKCIECGQCRIVCPGKGIDLMKANLKTYGCIPKNPYLGNYVDTYIGHAIDDHIRYNGSSGGVGTALSSFALGSGIIDGAIVVRMNGIKAEAFIAKTKEELLDATGSKYQPVPINSVLKEIINSKEDARYLIMGLPCQIQGILNTESLFPILRKKIVYKIGLFCGGQPSIWGTRFILWKYKISPKSVSEMKYRGRGWPGGLTITLLSGKKITVSESEYWPYVAYFINPRCRLCTDHTAEFSDISLGDPWLKDFHDPFGSSIIIARSQLGDSLLKKAEQSGAIRFDKFPWNKIFKSQFDGIMFKKSKISSKKFVVVPKKMPEFNMQTMGYPKLLTIDRLIIYNIAYLLASSRKWSTLCLFHIAAELNMKLFWCYLLLFYRNQLRSK